MKWFFFICFAAIVFLMVSCLPQAVIPSAARLSTKDYARAIHKERRARVVAKTRAMSSYENYYNWQRNIWAKARKLPSSKRWKFVKNARSQLVDSALNSKHFYFNTSYSVNFGYKNRYSGGLMRADSVLYCYFGGPLYFRSTDFEYVELSRTAKKTELEIRVRNISATELSTNPFQVLIKMVVHSNLEAELIISSPDGRSNHVTAYGSIYPTNKKINIPRDNNYRFYYR